jgi:phosphatidylglycerophosphate synthase
MVRLGTEWSVGVVVQLVVLTLVSAAVGLTLLGWLLGTAVGLTTVTLLVRGLQRAGSPAMGPADRVTLARATLVGAVTALTADALFHPAEVSALVGISIVAVLLDGVDGRVARGTGTASSLGARFDMEVDAFLVLVLSVLAARSLGGWVLAIGAARYLFVAAGWALPWLRAATPPRYWCKVVAVIQAAVLTVTISGVLPVPVARVLVLLALVLLVESFGRDVWWLVRHRPTRYVGAGSTSGAPSLRSAAGLTAAQPAAAPGRSSRV